MLQQQTRARWTRRGLALGLVAVATAAMTGQAVSQQGTPPAVPVAGPAPVATIYGGIAITHEEFGKFLMDRGGADKLEIFVNKKIIEIEAKRLNVTVTDLELKAAFRESVARSGEDGVVISEKDFIRVVLPKFGKNLYEWMEDIERPRLLLTKMCRENVKVTEEDLKLQFDRRYGEMRQAQIIMWPLGDDTKSIAKIWDRIRNNAAEFNSEARQQANPSLAATAGEIKPITRHLAADDKKVEEVAFQLKEGEVSQILHTQQGYMVIKLKKILPANTDVKFADHRANLEKVAREAKLQEEIPKYFAKLRAAANPQLKYVGPAEWKQTGNFLDGLPNVIQEAGAKNPVVPTPGK